MSTDNIFERVDDLLKQASERAVTKEAKYRIEDIQVHSHGYAEPGYTTDSGVILTGNWNGVSHYVKDHDAFITHEDTISWLAKELDRIGVEREWGDEWAECAECQRLVRTSPDSYHWKPNYAVLRECEILCMDCIKSKCATEYLEELEGSSHNCVTLDMDLEEHGYVQVMDDLERGFCNGQDADPVKIANTLKAAGVSRYIFKLDEPTQFYITFSTWVHKDEYEKVSHRVFYDGDVNGPSVSGALKAALQGAT